MENLGFIFGLFGFIVGAGAWQQISNLKKEVESLRRELEDSGKIKSEPESDKK